MRIYPYLFLLKEKGLEKVSTLEEILRISFLFYFQLTTAFAFPVKNKPESYLTKCESAIDERLAELKSANDWIRVIDSKSNHRTYRTPTKIIGEWLEVVAGDAPSMSHITANGIREFVWNPRSCAMTISTVFEGEKKYISVSGPRFTDADLKKYLDEKENVILYAYSPSMTYSIRYLEDMATSAKKLGFAFIPLLDPRSSVERSNEVFPNVGKYKIQKAASVEIVMRQMLSHYPASLVIYNGKILDPFIFGAMSKSQYEAEIVRRLLNAEKTAKETRESK